MTISLMQDTASTVLGSAAAGAIAWGVFAVSPLTSAAVLGTAVVVYMIAKAFFDASDQVACEAAAIGGLLSKGAIYYFAMPSLSVVGIICLMVGAFVIKIPVHALLFKNAPPSPANQ